MDRQTKLEARGCSRKEERAREQIGLRFDGPMAERELGAGTPEVPQGCHSSLRNASLEHFLPWSLMDDAEPGLLKALDPHWRGGACGQIIEDGEISVGDSVKWL